MQRQSSRSIKSDPTGESKDLDESARVEHLFVNETAEGVVPSIPGSITDLFASLAGEDANERRGIARKIKAFAKKRLSLTR